jgi:urease accessory protein
VHADHALHAALQLSDSTLPIGRFAHSLGLEALTAANPEIDEGALVETIATFVLESAGPLEGVAVAAAYRIAEMDDLLGLFDLDRLVSARKITPAARLASTSCGHRLASLAPVFTVREPATAFCAAVGAGTTDGHLATVHGALAQACGLKLREAVLIELRGAAWTLLSALVRLDRLSSIRAQAALRELTSVIETAAADAERAPVESMRSVALELETYAIVHQRAEVRHFMT